MLVWCVCWPERVLPIVQKYYRMQAVPLMSPTSLSRTLEGSGEYTQVVDKALVEYICMQ